VGGSAEIEAHLGVAPGWFATRTGVRARRVSGDGASRIDPAERAARAAGDAARSGPSSVGVLRSSAADAGGTPGAIVARW
jgi:3-oxoacyl-[acyl-carrier-protein] synthase III